MKTYEEMARDVLRRRDEELSSITQASQLQSQINPPPEVVYPAAPKKRGKLGLLPKIAIPCAAAVLAGVVGLNVWKNVQKDNSRGKYINAFVAEDEPGTPEHNDGVAFTIAAEQPAESIYKGGKTEININEAGEWNVNVHHLPLLSAEDFRPIDDDRINGYYGMEFDRLSKVFPDWKSEHEPFGVYEHDEDDGFVVSHGLIYNTNCISYTTENGGSVSVAASLRRYDTATVEDAKASVVNGFDAMIYKIPSGDYAADIEMGFAYVTITAVGVDEEDFLNILDVYTAPDKGSDDNNNHNQTMEDKIVVYNGIPDFIMDQIPFEPTLEDTTDCTHIRYTSEQLNELYGINFFGLEMVHSHWQRWYGVSEFGIFVRDYPGAAGEDMAASGGREIVSTRNEVHCIMSEGYQVSIIALKGTIPETDIEHSVVNGYDAVIFRGKEYNDVSNYGAAIDMDGTIVYLTIERLHSDDEFIDLVREYTSKASKYNKHSDTSSEPAEFSEFNAVDPFDDDITYKVGWDDEFCWWTRTAVAEPFGLLDTDNLETTLGCLNEFFGTDKLLVDETFKSNLTRYKHDGRFCCITAEGAKAYSPVDGKVVAVYDDWYNGGLGKAVTVEFGDGKYFIIGHFAEVNVEVGDYVEPGQVLGVCGQTGAVAVEEDEALLTLIALQKVD